MFPCVLQHFRKKIWNSGLAPGVPIDMVDGGGLCSPGCWPPEQRRPPGDEFGPVRRLLMDQVLSLESRLSGEGISLKALVFKAAAGA